MVVSGLYPETLMLGKTSTVDAQFSALRVRVQVPPLLNRRSSF